MSLTMRQMADVHMNHITANDSHLLSCTDERGGVLRVLNNSMAYFISVHPWGPSGNQEDVAGLESDMRREGYSSALINLCRMAGTQGAALLCLDVDGEEYADLAWFEW